jgi:hypothetical protein
LAQLLIDNDILAEEFFEDSMLIGVQCGSEPHQFIWMVNRKFAYDFRYQAGSEIEFKKRGRNFKYPIFSCSEPHTDLQHLIYANRHDGEYLLPELKHFDFLWLMKGELKDIMLPEMLLSELKTLDLVQMVTILSNDKIINKTRLVL